MASRSVAASTSDVMRPCASIDHPHHPVVEHVLVADLIRLDRLGRRLGRGDGQRPYAVAGVRRRVELESACPRADQGCDRLVDDDLGPSGDRGVVALGVLVHPGDGATRQDVVELLQQHQLPERVELLVRVVEPRPDGRGRRPQLGLAEQVLAAPVPLLGPGLAWCRCRGEAPGTSPRSTPEDARTRPPPRRRRPAACRSAPSASPPATHPPGRSEHLPVRAAAAVAVPERHERAVGQALLAVLPLGPREVCDRTDRCCRCRPAGSG